jgi:hypothetical protein
MSRPTGVTVSAVIAILGSLGAVVLAGFMTFGAVMMAQSPQLTPPNYPGPASVVTILIAEIALTVGFAVFGILSAVGLLRMRNWARICFVIFAALLVFGSGSMIVGSLISLIAMPQLIPPDANVPPGFLVGTFVSMAIISLVLGALATWWLIYFNRRSMRVEFMGEAAASAPRRGPLSITIIGWLLVVGSFWAIPYGLFVSAYPAIVLGTILVGWAGRVFLIVFGVWGLATGIGLLKWRFWAHPMAVALYLFGIVNGIAAVVMGTAYRIQDYMPLPYRGFDQGSLLQLGMIAGLVFSFVPLAFLLARRKAFNAACQTPLPTMS